MEPNFKADEFSRLTPSERVTWCRRMAGEAARLAEAAADPPVRAAYVELSKQWTALANEIERDAARTV
jgi:sirohydrochlorin ferrochelatase